MEPQQTPHPNRAPTAELSGKAALAIQDALREKLGSFNLVIESVQRDRAFVNVIAKNDVSFLNVTWDPRDQYRYQLGPLIESHVPPLEIWYDPNRSPNRYELGWFVDLRASRLSSADRGTVLNYRKSPESGMRAICLFAAEELSGDWSMRSALDRLVLKNYREQVEPNE